MQCVRSQAIVAFLFGFVAVASGACGGLLWSDEFAGPAGSPPSEAKWVLEEGDGTNQSIPGWGNQELQYYMRDSATLDGTGHLVITARAAGATRYKCYYGPCRFTSARLASRFSGHYGRFETRLRTTARGGTWPAFWMLGANVGQVGWPACGEIDVMEARGRKPDTVSAAAHGPGYSGDRALSHSHRLTNGTFADDFHVVAVDWRPESLAWSVDGVIFGTERNKTGQHWVFDHPFYLLLNMAVGGHFGGPPAGEANFTERFVVDYVRVYDLEDNCTSQETPTTTPDERSTVASGRAKKGVAPAIVISWLSWSVAGLTVVFTMGFVTRV